MAAFAGRTGSPHQAVAVYSLQYYSILEFAVQSCLSKCSLLWRVLDPECAHRLWADENFVEAGVLRYLLDLTFDGLGEALVSGLFGWPFEVLPCVVNAL